MCDPLYKRLKPVIFKVVQTYYELTTELSSRPTIDFIAKDSSVKQIKIKIFIFIRFLFEKNEIEFQYAGYFNPCFNLI